MTEERDFAGFVLPFATGILLTSYFLPAGMPILYAVCSAALAATALLSVILMHPKRKDTGHSSLWIIIIALGACLGAFIWTGDAIMKVSSPGEELWEYAVSSGKKTGTFIDSIPFADPRTNAVVKALVIGERSGIPPEVSDAFRESGASHILALSGFHLGIVYSIVSALLSVIGNTRFPKIVRSVTIVLFCGFYTLAAGAGESMVRAFLFILLRETAMLTHRHHGLTRIMLSSMLIQLVISPSSISSVSFQLSYAAIAGIALIYPRLRSFWPGKPSSDMPAIKAVRKIWDSAALSIACQMTTGPLAWIYFRSFPEHFLLTNMLALPLTGMIIPAVLLTMVLHFLGICPPLVVHVTETLVTTLTSCLEIIAGM